MIGLRHDIYIAYYSEILEGLVRSAQVPCLIIGPLKCRNEMNMTIIKIIFRPYIYKFHSFLKRFSFSFIINLFILNNY